jgi:NifU-like domain
MNNKQVLDEVRPYLIADGGNCRVVGVDLETRYVLQCVKYHALLCMFCLYDVINGESAHGIIIIVSSLYGGMRYTLY